jgi:hypothetical protein
LHTIRKEPQKKPAHTSLNPITFEEQEQRQAEEDEDDDGQKNC